MHVIISASRRTDIPAFYSDWFLRRLRAGFVDVVNPFNRRQVSRVSLRPEDVDCIVFWTKNPAPMLGRLEELTPYPFYVQVSLTPYDVDIERGLPPKAEIVGAMRELSRRLGRHRVVWRYDPILLNERYTIDRHRAWFGERLEDLAPFVERCVFSYIDLYAKTKKNTQGLGLREITGEEMDALAESFSRLAAGSGMALQTCSEAIDLSRYGIRHGACIDGALVERVAGRPLHIKKAAHQRPLCNCAESFDVGQYDTCVHGCRYCYANAGEERARLGFARHDPSASVITGALSGDEHITAHDGAPAPR